MESQPQNPESRNNPENFHPYSNSFQTIGIFHKDTYNIKSGDRTLYKEGTQFIIRECSGSVVECLTRD